MKVLVNTAHTVDVWKIPEKYILKLKREFPQLNIVFIDNRENLPEEIEDADIYFGWFPGKEAFGFAKRLKWVHTPQIGVGKFLSVEGLLNNVILTNASPVDRRQIGEFAFSLFLGLHFGHGIIVKNYLEKIWARKEVGDFLLDERRKPLKEMKAVVLGFGGIGRVIVELLQGTVKDIAVVKRRKEDLPFKVFTLNEWRDFLPFADVIFISIPADKRSTHFINREKINCFVNSPYIVNVGRGKVVSETDIADGLKRGKIKGYATDVCETEPPGNDFPLWGFDNVIVSPHVAALEPEFWEKQYNFFVSNLKRFLGGEKLEGVVNA